MIGFITNQYKKVNYEQSLVSFFDKQDLTA